MDIYTSIKKETVEKARDRALAELKGIVSGDVNKVYELVDEVRELNGILNDYAEREKYTGYKPLAQLISEAEEEQGL